MSLPVSLPPGGGSLINFVYDETIQHHLQLYGFPQEEGMESLLPIDSDTQYFVDAYVSFGLQDLEGKVSLSILRLRKNAQEVPPTHSLEEVLS
jgi:hypothetical protein